MQKISEIEQHLLFFIDFLRVPKYRVRPITSRSPFILNGINVFENIALVVFLNVSV